MSQYGANYYQEQQPQGPYNYQQNQTQSHYLTEESSYGPPPYTEQSYPQGQDQHYNNSGYDQRYGAMADMPQGGNTPPYRPEGANTSYYDGEPLSDSNGHNVPEGEKGLGSTVVGGAAGGYMGHKMGGGWSTAAGAALGAVGANVISHKM